MIRARLCVVLALSSASCASTENLWIAGADCETWISPAREKQVGVTYRPATAAPGDPEFLIELESDYDVAGVPLDEDDSVIARCTVPVIGNTARAALVIDGTTVPGVAAPSALDRPDPVLYASGVTDRSNDFTLEIHFGDVLFEVPFVKR